MSSSIKFTGLASGIDSASLIDALIEARSATNTKREEEVDYLESENDALEQLNTKILALNDLLDEFRTVNGGGLKKKSSSSDTDVLTAVAGSGAINSSFSVTVNNLAQNASASFDKSYSASTDYVSTSGSGDVKFTVGTGSNQKTITVSVTANSTTVGQLVDQINNSSEANGRFAASIVNAGTESSPDYRIMVSTLKQGTEEGQLAITVDPAITELQDHTLDDTTNAKDASLSLAGISGSIKRSSNTVDDLVSGVTLQLSSNGSSTVSVTDDSDATFDLMSQIVDAYNDIVEFCSDNDYIDQSEENEDGDTVLTYGTLAKTSVDDNFLSTFRSALAGASSSHGTSVTCMSELGISTKQDGTIEIDEDEFIEALSQDSLGAQDVIADFADTLGGTTGTIYEYTKYQGTIDIAQDANSSEIDNLNDAIDRLERQLSGYREMLELKYAKLESTISQMQTEGSSLSSALASL